jgi:hypothetical protein
VVKAPRLPQVEGGPRGVPEVLVGQLVDVGVGGAALALAAVVVLAGQLVEQLGALDEQALLEDEEPSQLPVGQDDADRLVLLHHRLELAHGR